MRKKQKKLSVTRNDLLLSKMQAMTEAEFTNETLVPLFKAMGYQVDYHGGPGEGGKDIICRKGGDFGYQEIGVIQVKKTTPSAAAGRANSFAGIVSQLQQASEKKVPSLSGQAQLPNHVYFVTPFEIDTRALESRFEAVAGLAHRGVRILDGRIVVDELTRLLPELAERICGESFTIKDKLLSNISNADLLSALNYSSEKRISDFYCDLDFGVGKVTTKLLFAMEFSPTVLSHSIPQSRWPNFEALAKGVESLVQTDMVEPPIEDVKRIFTKELDRWRSPSNQAVIKHISRIGTELEDMVSSFVERARQVISDTLTEEIVLDGNKRPVRLRSTSELTVEQSARLNRIRESNVALEELFESWRGFRYLTTSIYEKIQETLSSCDDHVQQIRAEISILKSTAKDRLTTLLKDAVTLNSMFKQLGNNLAKRVAEPNYEIRINGPVLAEEIVKQRSWISAGIRSLSNRKQTSVEIRHFFLRCQHLFEILERVFDDKYFSEALCARAQKELCFAESSQRISMPLREVFATGIHCAVYGEAGAGKSTTLHQYAAYASGNDSDNELTLFLPLTRILAERMLPPNESEYAPVQKLEGCLANFLGSGKSHSAAGMIEFIKSKKRVTFIFDGVDEVIKRAPWIIEAISQIETSYNNCQVILSSRTSGSYVNDIKYLGLTLLPFTDEQVSYFIDGWFIQDPSCAQEVKRHLSRTPDLREIVRSPLLTTILCVLAENRVPLPNGELSMYAERFKLLLGHYDIHKRATRIESHHSLLENTARKLAFYLHSRNLRSSSPEDLETAAIRIAAKQLVNFDETKIRKAVQELIDPCNVLVPMTADGDFGFGHLRYQEYLSASELRFNRGIDLAPLLTSPWWRSVLVLFSRMTDDIAYVVTDVLEKGINVTKCRDNLLAMIATRGRTEKRQLTSLIEGHVRLDAWDRDMRDYDNFDDDERSFNPY